MLNIGGLRQTARLMPMLARRCRRSAGGRMVPSAPVGWSRGWAVARRHAAGACRGRRRRAGLPRTHTALERSVVRLHARRPVPRPSGSPRTSPCCWRTCRAHGTCASTQRRACSPMHAGAPAGATTAAWASTATAPRRRSWSSTASATRSSLPGSSGCSPPGVHPAGSPLTPRRAPTVRHARIGKPLMQTSP